MCQVKTEMSKGGRAGAQVSTARGQAVKRANWEVQHLKVDRASNLLFIRATFDDITRLHTRVKQ